MNTKRLNKLIEYMESIKEGRVYMRHWFAHKKRKDIVGSHHAVASTKDLKKALPIECGMSACALGWACMVPAFNRAGLVAEQDNRSFFPVYLRGEYGRARGFDAAEQFFDLNEKQVRRLFGYSIKVKTPKEWAARARGVVRQWAKA